MDISQLLFSVGAALMALAAFGGLLAVIILHRAGKRLDAQLEREFGKRRH